VCSWRWADRARRLPDERLDVELRYLDPSAARARDPLRRAGALEEAAREGLLTGIAGTMRSILWIDTASPNGSSR